MKSIRNFLIGMVITGSLAAGLHFLHAQETPTSAISQQQVNAMSDTEVLLQAVELTPPTAANAVPRFGTFYSALHAPGTRWQWPPLPGNIRQVPVWNLGDGLYLLDDLQVDYSLPVSSRMAGGGMGAMDDSGGPPMPGGGGGGGSTNDYEYSFTPPVYTTNDLWLQMNGVTNTTAYLTIHPSWNFINGVYDLLYTTNLSAPISWQWLLRSFAGQTNLIVNNATDPQGFYWLGTPTNDLTVNGSLGTNFWVAFYSMDPYPQGWNNVTNRELWLYISSPVGASGTVTIPGLGISNNFTVAAGAVTNMSIPTNAMMGGPWFYDGGLDYYSLLGYQYDPSLIVTNGIHVVASQPVSVYAMYYQPAGSTAYTCYPTTLLGTNYCLMAWPAYTDGYGDSIFAIAATADNTTVTITPSATADLWDDEGNFLTNYTLTLQQGWTYQIHSQDPYPWTDDVTGTWITSDKPIAVFAGASLACVPDVATQAGNPLEQEQLPVDSWGTLTLALSFAGRTNGDTYRVLAAYSNTVVTITGTVVTVVGYEDSPPWTVTKSNEVLVVTLQAGQFFQINLDGPVEFQASQPIQVAQFANGTWFDHVYDTNDEADPCEILLPPVGHYFVTNTVFTPFYNASSTGDFDENYLNIIVAQSSITNTLVDGFHLATTNFVAIGTSGYYGARLSVTNGMHKVISSLPVGVEVYGFGVADAYSYFGGIVK